MNDILLYERVAPLEKNFPIKFSVHKGRCFLHWHEHLELLYYLSDGDKVFCGEKTYTVHEGDLVVVNPNILHATYSGRFYCMRIAPSFFADVRFDGALIEPHIVKDPTVANSIAQIARAKEAGDVGSDMEIKGEAYRLISYLLRNFRAESLSDGETNTEKNKATRVREIVLYMTHNCHEHITTASLAERFHLDEHYLCRLFKGQMGAPPMQYLNAYRVERAKALLTNTDRSVTDIALAVGFDDPSYFARIFKRVLGVTPREYKGKKDQRA